MGALTRTPPRVSLEELAERAARDVMELEIVALGDHCLLSQLKPIILAALRKANGL